MLLCGLGSGGIISWPAPTQACSAAAFYTRRQPELVTKVSPVVQILWAGCLWACNWPLLANWCGDKERERIDFKSLLFSSSEEHTSAASCFREPLSTVCSNKAVACPTVPASLHRYEHKVIQQTSPVLRKLLVCSDDSKHTVLYGQSVSRIPYYPWIQSRLFLSSLQEVNQRKIWSKPNYSLPTTLFVFSWEWDFFPSRNYEFISDKRGGKLRPFFQSS